MFVAVLVFSCVSENLLHDINIAVALGVIFGESFSARKLEANTLCIIIICFKGYRLHPMHRSRGLVTSARIGVAVQLEVTVRPISFSVLWGNPFLGGLVLDRTLPGQYQRAAAVDLIRHRPDIWVVVVVVLDFVAVALTTSRPVFIDRDSALRFIVRQQVVMDNLVVDGVVDRIGYRQGVVAVAALHLPVNFVPFDLCVRVRAGLSIENKMFFYQLLHFFCCNLFVVDCIAEIDVEGDLLLFQVVPALIIIRLVEIIIGQFGNIIGFWRKDSPLNLGL